MTLLDDGNLKPFILHGKYALGWLEKVLVKGKVLDLIKQVACGSGTLAVVCTEVL